MSNKHIAKNGANLQLQEQRSTNPQENESLQRHNQKAHRVKDNRQEQLSKHIKASSD